MSSQFTTQALSDYLSSLASSQSSLSTQTMEDQDLLDSQKELLAEQKQRGVEMLSASVLPGIHVAYKVGTTIKSLADKAIDFKNKVETAGKQISEAPENLEGIGKSLGNKLSNIGEDAVSNLKNTASKKMSGLVDDATEQGADVAGEAQASLSSIFESSRIGNMFSRIKQVFTPGEQQAKQMQEQAFEQDPEAGIRDVAPEAQEAPKPMEVTPEVAPKAVESAPVESVAEDVAKPVVESSVEDVAKSAGEDVAKSAGEAVGEAVGEGVASLVPGVGTAIEAGLLLWQGIEGLKDLFHHPSQPPPPPIVNEAQPTFQAGI